VGNDPTNLTDPNGLQSWSSWFGEQARVIGAAGTAFVESVDHSLTEMVTAPIKEGMTVWGNTANQDMGTVQRLYVSVGTPVATIVGVRGLDDARSQHDAVDGHVQSTTERVTDGVIGTASLALKYPEDFEFFCSNSWDLWIHVRLV